MEGDVLKVSVLRVGRSLTAPVAPVAPGAPVAPVAPVTPVTPVAPGVPEPPTLPVTPAAFTVRILPAGSAMTFPVPMRIEFAEKYPSRNGKALEPKS